MNHLVHNFLRYEFPKISEEFSNINDGGCAFMAKAIKRILSERLNVEADYFVFSDQRGMTPTEAINNIQRNPCAHVAISFDGVVYDSEGVIEEGSRWWRYTGDTVPEGDFDKFLKSNGDNWNNDFLCSNSIFNGSFKLGEEMLTKKMDKLSLDYFSKELTP